MLALFRAYGRYIVIPALMLFLITGDSQARRSSEKIVLSLGSEKSDYDISPRHIILEKGRPYRLRIISRGFKPYHLVAPEFFAAIDLDEIQAEGVEIEAQKLESIALEEEFEPVKVDILFTPHTIGKYDMVVRGMERWKMSTTITIR